MYYLARKINDKPFVVFDLVAMSEKELSDRGLNDNPLILDFKPREINGVSEYKIEDDKLIKRTKTELESFKSDYEYQLLQERKKRLKQEIMQLKLELIVNNDLKIDDKNLFDLYNQKIGEFNKI